MDLIEPIWTAAYDWKVRLLVLIVLANMILAVRLYMLMGKKRFAAVREGRVPMEVYKSTQNEPQDLAIYNRIVLNQFESPVLFYALIAIGLALNVTSWLTVILAAIYVAIRYVHANEMTHRHDILKRQKLFVYSFQTLLALMVELAVSTLLWA